MLANLLCPVLAASLLMAPAPVSQERTELHVQAEWETADSECRITLNGETTSSPLPETRMFLVETVEAEDVRTGDGELERTFVRHGLEARLFGNVHEKAGPLRRARRVFLGLDEGSAPRPERCVGAEGLAMRSGGEVVALLRTPGKRDLTREALDLLLFPLGPTRPDKRPTAHPNAKGDVRHDMRLAYSALDLPGLLGDIAGELEVGEDVDGRTPFSFRAETTRDVAELLVRAVLGDDAEDVSYTHTVTTVFEGTGVLVLADGERTTLELAVDISTSDDIRIEAERGEDEYAFTAEVVSDCVHSLELALADVR